MAIAVNCPKCGKGYKVDDRAAGRRVKCRECGGTFAVAAKGSSSDDPFAAMDDLAALARSDSAAPPPPPRGAPSLRPPAIGVAPPATLSAAPRPAPVMSYSKPSRRPVKLDLSDPAAKGISILLIFAFVGLGIWATISIANLAFGVEAMPEGLQSKVYTVITFSLIYRLIYFFVVLTPVMLFACSLASGWTNWSLPDGAYTRAAGTMALPSVILLTLFWMLMQPEREPALIISILVALPFLMILGLKALMGLKWSTTFVAAGLLVVAVPIAALLSNFVERKIAPGIASAAGLDEKGLKKYFADHPDELEQYRGRRFAMGPRRSDGNPFAAPGGGNASFSSQGGPRYTPPPAPPDPLVGKIEPLLVSYRAAIAEAKNLLKEDLEPRRAALAAQLGAVAKPAEYSRLYEEANRLNAELSAAVGKAPSRTPPATLFTAIPDTPIAFTSAAADDYRAPDLAFRSLVLKPVKGTKVDLKRYAARESSQTWLLRDHPPVTLELSVQPLRDPSQQRPWVAANAAVAQIAAEKNLFAVPVGGSSSESADVSVGRANGIGWTRVVKPEGSGSRINSAMYVARLPDGWLVAKLDNGRFQEDALAVADKIIGGLRIAKTGEPPAVDAFAPSEVVERFSETWDDPAAVLRQQPQELVVAALKAYATKKGNVLPHAARSLLAELAGEAAVPMTPREVEKAKPMDVPTALAALGGTNPWDRRKAMADLARVAPKSDAEREQVAPVLEAILLKEAFFVGDEIAPAMAVWWRPRTISALLPSMEENGDRWQRKAAFKILPKTKDKSVVFPIIRWIVKEPESVVFALQEMGPVAEDEAIKLLRQKDAAVRSNAARILEVVGTRKSLSELTRASKDPRDPGAAAAAKRALDAVKERGDAPAAPATATTTGPSSTGSTTKPATPVPPATPPKVGVVPPADKPDAPAKAGKGWALGQKVQVKWSTTWYDSTIEKKTADGWHLITYDGWSSMEWVEPWRIRARNSTADEIGPAQPNKSVRDRESPPAVPPGPPPAPR